VQVVADNLCTQTKLYKPQTSHTVAVFEALVTTASQLLATSATRPLQLSASWRSDAATHHPSTATAARTDAAVFRHQVLFCNLHPLLSGFLHFFILSAHHL